MGVGVAVAATVAVVMRIAVETVERVAVAVAVAVVVVVAVEVMVAVATLVTDAKLQVTLVSSVLDAHTDVFISEAWPITQSTNVRPFDRWSPLCRRPGLC